jgi:CheY-like chemotaxis protein
LKSESSNLDRNEKEESHDISPVLLVEDNTNDILITQRMWNKAKIENPLIVVRDGEEALDFLFGRGDYADVTEVGLVLLDLHMPRVDGFEVLRRIRNSWALKRLPVIFLTGSYREKDKNRAYDLGCDGFIVKPLTLENFTEAVRDIQRFNLMPL